MMSFNLSDKMNLNLLKEKEGGFQKQRYSDTEYSDFSLGSQPLVLGTPSHHFIFFKLLF